jgi:hypothetical protein
MSEVIFQGPPEEQLICVACGMCCDATIFSHAILQPWEKGNLPEKIEQNYRTAGGKEFFLQPCLYFIEKCTIYDKKRADVCSSFRCQLLKDFAEAKISVKEAMETVGEAIKMRLSVMEQYRNISKNDTVISFRQVLTELGVMQKSFSLGKPDDPEFEMLLARCNIFEALLIKHFRSARDFELIMAGDEITDISNKAIDQTSKI